MTSSAPLIGMTDTISNCTVNDFSQLLLDAEFMQAHINAKEVTITGPYANSLHIHIEEDIFRDPIGLKKLPLIMESELIFEKTDESAWDFYVLHNNLFYNLGGRLRIRQLGSKMKIGLYLLELNPKEPIAEEFDEEELIAIIRNKFRFFIDKLRQNAQTGLKSFNSQPKINNLN